MDGTKPVPPETQVSRDIRAVAGGARFVAAWFCNYLMGKKVAVNYADARPAPETIETD